MPTDTSKVYVPSPNLVKGIIYRAPLGTPIPTDAATDLADAFNDLGGISEAGIINAVARDTKKIKDFGGNTIAITQSDYTETIEVELVESTRLEVLKTVFGDANVTFTPATADKGALIQIDHNSDMLPKMVYVTETIQGDGIRRQVAPIGQPITVGDVTQINTDIVKYKVTIECFAYTDGESVFNTREYVDDGKPITGITVAPPTAAITGTGTHQLTVTDSSGNDVTATATYVSGTTAHATVDSAGLVTGVAAGTSVITATYLGFTGTCTVTVS